MTAEQFAEYIIDRLRPMTDDDRKKVFEWLATNFCMHCGSDDPRCQCCNDD